MAVLALIPSVSVMTVTARAAAFGFIQGLFTALGIVVGDIIFILIAVYGLAFAAELMGAQFTLIKLIGGVYLIWLGISLWRSGSKSLEAGETTDTSRTSSFMSGLLITLGDQKEILFYLGFFPAFLDLARVTIADTLIIIVIATVTVGGAKLIYAFLADRASLVFDNRAAVRGINIAAAGVMIAIGILLLLKTLEWL